MSLREQGITKLKDFTENHLSNYAKSRNFDYGPDNEIMSAIFQNI